MLVFLLVSSGLAAQNPVAKIKDLARDGKYEKAADQCERLIAKAPDDQELRETCANAAWNLVGEDKASLDGFAAAWDGTTAGKRAHRQAGALALEDAGEDPDKLRDLVATYDGTLPAEEALRRLTHADFVVARDAGDARSMAMFLTLHPDAAHGAMATNIVNTRRFDEAAAWNSSAAWQIFLETWPEHPRTEDARGRMADCVFAEATTPDALLAFALDWPDHARAVEALEGALPLLVTIEHRDSDLSVATSSLESVTVTAPEAVVLTLWVEDLPAAEVCSDAPEAIQADGEVRFPYGRCAVDGEPVHYRLRASVADVHLDTELIVRQARQDPTQDLALRFGPVGQLKEGCAVPTGCTPSRIAASLSGALIIGVLGAGADEEVAWWAVPPVGEVLEAPIAPAGSWRGPLAAVSALALSPDGTRLAVGYCSDALASLYLVDIASDRILGTRDGLCPQDLAFAPGGLALAVVGADGVTVIDGLTAVTREQLSSAEPARVAAWSPDGERLAWWSQGPTDGRVRLWSGGQTSALDPVSAKDRQPRRLAVTADGQRTCLLADRAYDCWNPETGQPLRTADLAPLQPTEGPALPIAMSADLDLVAIGSPTGSVQLVDGRTAVALLVLEGPTAAISDLLMSADGTRLAAVDASGAVTLWAAR